MNMAPINSMADNSNTPKFFSLEFHLKFFPGLLLSKLRPKKEEPGTRFVSTFEFYILLAFFFVLIAMAMPLALKNGSIIGWLIAFIGIVGILALIISSIIAQWGTRPSFDNFLWGIFSFFVFLGLTVGIFVGKTEFASSWWPLFGILGLILGYLVGLLAGLWLQCLGWIVGILNLLCGCAVIGMIVVDAVLLFSK
jgi:hypothetical protein